MPITTQISCKIPIKIWNAIKDIGEQRGTNATKITTKALEGVIRDYNLQESLSNISIGDKVSAVTYSGQGYISYPVKSKKGKLGIIIKQPAQIFVPLSDFGTVELEEW